MEYVHVAENPDDQVPDIAYMVAKCAADFQLEPIVISGGTYAQQEMAIENALKLGFTNITVTPPRKDDLDNKTTEYDRLITLAEEVTEKYHKHAECLDQIDADKGHPHPLDSVHDSVKSSLTPANQALYNGISHDPQRNNDSQQPPPRIGSV